MPDRRTHRGPHPEDESLFAPAEWEKLRRATADLSWLFSRGYAGESSLKLVGDRYALLARQRIAVARCASADAHAAARQARRVDVEAVRGAALWIDGYNVLTSIEAALSGGVILAARDGTYRDMASMHGSYRRVSETRPALERLGQVIAATGAASVVWYLDRPVSNSGRLKREIEHPASQHGWPWRVELVDDPDRVLISCSPLPLAGEGLGVRAGSPPVATPAPIIATADSAILDHCGRWFNLARETIDRTIPDARIVPLGLD